MIVNKRDHIRELGVKRISTTRNLALKKTQSSVFNHPNNFFQLQTTSNWNCTTTSPPQLTKVNDNKIQSQPKTCETVGQWKIRQFRCHTQAVERCVKLVTETPQKVVGFNCRNVIIRKTFFSRSSVPSFHNKSYFKLQKARYKEIGIILRDSFNFMIKSIGKVFLIFVLYIFTPICISLNLCLYVYFYIFTYIYI